ncbi:pyridoxamine 5'-phosphate oxidase family protein [Nitrosopumilus sp.]|uniref:pyridoxamine 5'-phosphate oxidase family protein n=1 Tax=Nitrosopumilus sp. TaxID=2024843 RepID=UPI00247C5983|nr:pyridoxamine 5'-phosphate oxidase family protein [Nitrosopumilus sp.]MCV0430214.1 pyridoxamine 5'-phosphate oxidase family protein [Nitrosopumilus sp.]
MKKFTEKEKIFLNSIEEARIATSHDNIPHVKPVSFILVGNEIIVATDYNTRTFSNIKSNTKIGIVMDVYKSGNHKAVCIQGNCEIVETGEEFNKLYDIFYKKFSWVRKDPWKEKEAPFLKINPTNKTSWGIN